MDGNYEKEKTAWHKKMDRKYEGKKIRKENENIAKIYKKRENKRKI